MKHLINGLKQHGIGRRAMTEDDFWRICAEESIEVVWSRKQWPFYFTTGDVKAIVLPDRLTGARLLFVAFHELAHHWKDGGDEPCIAFLGGSDKKCEAEADAIALVALMPEPDSQIFDTDIRFAQKLRDDRQRLFDLYGV